MNEHYNFHGTSQALGGSGYDKAAPGTTYIQTTFGTDVHRELRLNNQNRGSENACHYPTYLDESDDTYDFNVVDLTKRACLKIDSVSEARNAKFLF